MNAYWRAVGLFYLALTAVILIGTAFAIDFRNEFDLNQYGVLTIGFLLGGVLFSVQVIRVLKFDVDAMLALLLIFFLLSAGSILAAVILFF